MKLCKKYFVNHGGGAFENRKGVVAIFNLTEPGEHPHCGDGLEKISGFPYLPETFMREGSESRSTPNPYGIPTTKKVDVQP